MSKAKLRDKMRGEYGHFNADASLTATDYTADKFDVSDEVDQLFRKVIVGRTTFLTGTDQVTATINIFSPNRKKKVVGVKFFDGPAVAAATGTDYVTVDVKSGTDSVLGGTDSLLDSRVTARWFGTDDSVIDLTGNLGTDTLVQADEALKITLTKGGAGLGTDSDNVGYQIELEEAALDGTD